ncbi:MAG: hypothetical protein JXB49_00110 [Bacteroidales bacterium]|nr:hypothetical protein [Bacteroidales bacterium]
MKFLRQNKIQYYILLIIIFVSSCISANKEADNAEGALILEDEYSVENTREPEIEDFEMQGLSKSELLNYQMLALKKVNDFKDLMNILGQKQVNKTFRNHASGQLVDLFESGDIILNIDIQDRFLKFPVNDAENAITSSKLSKLYFNIDTMFVKQPFKLINDTVFEGIVQYNQEFIGMHNKDTVFHEHSVKNIGIKLFQQSKTFGDEIVDIWEVKLGRIESVEK